MANTANFSTLVTYGCKIFIESSFSISPDKFFKPKLTLKVREPKKCRKRFLNFQFSSHRAEDVVATVIFVVAAVVSVVIVVFTLNIRKLKRDFLKCFNLLIF